VDNLPFTAFDGIVVLIIVLSGILAFARGFVHEVLGLASWIGAGVIALLAYPHVQPIAREYIEVTLLADIAAGATVFIVSLVALWLVARAISGRIHSSGLGALDRSLGFVFGLARGALIVCIAFVGLNWLVPPEQQPPWMVEAKSRPLVAEGAQRLIGLAPADVIDTETIERTGAGGLRNVLETERLVRDMMSPQPKQAPTVEASPQNGYRKSERQELERLLDTDR
jgi:membrane protein required for colicin V production